MACSPLTFIAVAAFGAVVALFALLLVQAASRGRGPGRGEP